MKNSVMEIANFAAAYPGNFIASLRVLAEALRARNTDVVFVFPERARTRDWSKALQTDGYPVFFLPDTFTAAERLLRHVCRQYAVRLVHSHFIDRSIYLPLRVVCGKQIPHIFHAHSLPKFPCSDPRLFLRRFLMHPARVLCVSDAVRDAYTARGFSACTTIVNGIDFSRLDAAEPFPRKSPSVLMFGYDFRIKGIDTALDAFDRHDPAHRYTLRICVASHRNEAEAFLHRRFGSIPSWVELLPPRTDVGTYYRSADIFLSASRTEGMPYAVLEAAGCGLPLVLSDIAPHTLLRLPQVHLFPVGDPDALFHALSETGPADGVQNKSFVLQNHSMREWVDQVLSVFFAFLPLKDTT